MATVAEISTPRKAPRAFYAVFHGLAGVITRPAAQVLFLEPESGAVVTLTADDEAHLVVLGEVERAMPQYLDDMARGRAQVVCGRDEGRS